MRRSLSVRPVRPFTTDLAPIIGPVCPIASIDPNQGGWAGNDAIHRSAGRRGPSAVRASPWTQVIREEILSILDRASDMTLATIRGDGYPQATTVSYAHDGLDALLRVRRRLPEGPKHRRATTRSRSRSTCPMRTGARSAACRWAAVRHSLTRSARDGAGRAAPAGEVSQRASPSTRPTGRMGVAFFKVVPKVISVLDYRKGFGHTDLVSNDRGMTPA